MTKLRLAVGFSCIIFIISFAYLLAQGNDLFVTITRFEPQPNGDTVAYVTVVDNKGLPVGGLTKANFAILEDDKLNLSDKVTVESTDDTELRLVLALDVSMPPPEVATMKQAVITFIQAMHAKDQAAIIVFYDETKLVQDFTEDKAKLISIVEALQPAGDFTTLHETVYSATTKASQFEVGRRAVIIVTNSGNNTVAPYTADETIQHATELQVPLYVIALQTLNRLTSFQNVAALTGGQSYILKNATDVENSLKEIDKLLRPGYKITYPSQIAPDNQEHEAKFLVNYKGATGNSAAAEGTDKAKFVAVLDKIDVKIIGVNEGQTVTGLVNLMAEVTAPTKGVKVQYCLDDKVLGEATEPPYSFEWNTNQTAPGAAVLCAKAIDAAGHIGEAKMKVRVPVPLAVTVATDPRDRGTIGQVITVAAKVVALADIAKVDFLVNGDTVGSDNTAPYQFQWDSSKYQAGNYRLTARAEDVLGGKSEDSLQLELVTATVSPIIPTLSWWQRFLKWIRAPYSLLRWLACLSLLFLLFSLIFMVILVRYQKNKGRRLAHVEVTNLGNISSRYELRADDPDNALIFQFALNKASLPQRLVTSGNSGITPIYTTGLPLGARPVAPPPLNGGPSFVAGSGSVGVTPGAAGTTQQLADGSAAESGQVDSGGSSSQDKIKKLTAFGRMGGVIGEVLYAIAYVLPAFLATPVRTIAQTLRRADMASQRVDRGVQQLDKLQGNAPSRPNQGGQRGGAARPSGGTPSSQSGGGVGFNPLAGSQGKIEKMTALGRMGGVAGEVLYAIAYVLPDFLANPVRSIAGTLRRADMASQRIDRGVQQLDNLGGQVPMGVAQNDEQANEQPVGQQQPTATTGSYGSGDSATLPQQTTSPTAVAATQTPAISTPYAHYAATPPNPPLIQGGAGGGSAHALAPDAMIESWAESPYIHPGTALMVDLWIQAFRPYRNKRYSFVITSRSVEQEGAPVVVERGDIMLYNVLAIHRIFLPIAIFVSVILSIMVSLTLLLVVVGILS